MSSLIKLAPDAVLPGEDVPPGATIQLTKGEHTLPRILSGLRGTPEKPIVITCAPRSKVCVTGGKGAEERARTFFNATARRRIAAGSQPALGLYGDLALLTLRDCQYVIARDLAFTDCWPTAIYIDNAQFIALQRLTFTGGMFAIGANGRDTHHILVEGCDWTQDISEENRLWNAVPWVRIHGTPGNAPNVDFDPKREERHWDGDFFRAWDIRGDVVIRDNDIRDAFNAIHFFNRIDGPEPNSGRRAAANVLIENNRFTRIRDNVFEPENHAWNWVIRHNRLLDCYRPFSYELDRAGFIYVYGNRGGFKHSPSLAMSDEEKALIPKKDRRHTFSLFKARGAQANEGPVVVAHNSWVMVTSDLENGGFASSKGLFPKGVLGNLLHTNNAVQFISPGTISVFDGSTFTKDWATHGIAMLADTVHDPRYPRAEIDAGYAIGDLALNGSPAFADLDPGIMDARKVELVPTGSDVVGRAVPFDMRLPDGRAASTRPLAHRGAHQPDGAWNGIDAAFTFLPTFDWVDPALG